MTDNASADRVRYCEALVTRYRWPVGPEDEPCGNRAKRERFGHPVCGVHWRARFPRFEEGVVAK